MLMCYLSERAEVRDAGRKGDGIFATAPIAPGDVVAAFGGYICDRETLDTLPERRRSHSIQIHDHLFMLGAESDEPADFVNHSCEPNCGIVGSIVVCAMRDVDVDEELTIDYVMCDTDDYDVFDCACGASSCRKRLGPDDWMRPELQDKYAGYFSTYIARKITAIHAAE